MAAFTSFQNVLPDPNNKIADAGQIGGATNQPAGTAGPGFASVKLSSRQPMLRDITNSGRLLSRAVASHRWTINITYNPMTREQFEPVYNFLIQRRGSLSPFFVSLPQYRLPQNSSFSTWGAQSNGQFLESNSATNAGATSVLLDPESGATYSRSSNGTPAPGDLFTINSTTSNHLKAYRVTRVEDNTYYLSGTTQPSGTSQIRIHFVPGLAKSIEVNAPFKFNDPLIRVIQAGDVQEYSLGNNGLYQFSLNLEEVQ